MEKNGENRRAPNFSKLQERIILDMYVEKKDLLDAPLSRKVTKKGRIVWQNSASCECDWQLVQKTDDRDWQEL